MVEETHECVKNSDSTNKNMTDLMKKLNAFTEAVLSKDKSSNKKKVINPAPKTRSSQRKDDEEDEI
jgi:hypothetical protein